MMSNEKEKVNEIQPGKWVIDNNLPFITFIFSKLPDRDKISEVVCYLYETPYTKSNARAIVAIPEMIAFIKRVIVDIGNKPNSARYNTLIKQAYAILNEIEGRNTSDQTGNR